MMLQYLDTIVAFAVVMLGVSLLITILTQMISTLLGYRGTNLLWGIKTLLKTVEPGLAGKADSWARRVLETPLISDSVFSRFKGVPVMGRLTRRWRLGSTITAGELTSCLWSMTETKTKADTTDAKENDDEVKAGLLKTVLGQPDPEVTRKAQMILTILDDLGSKRHVQLDKAIQQLGASVQTSTGKIEAGFEAVMKRVSQRFALQMRIWTIIFAVLVSFGARLDSFDLLQRLWTDPALRSGLADQVQTLLKESSTILADDTDAARPAAPAIAPQILTDALARLREQEKEARGTLPKAPAFKSMNDAVEWLRANAKTDKTTQEKLVSRYRVLVVDELRKHAETIREGLTKSGFRLQMPTSYATLKDYFVGLSFWGILVTAAFLSLGAPFWFNALKTLGNLRPLTARSASGATQS